MRGMESVPADQQVGKVMKMTSLNHRVSQKPHQSTLIKNNNKTKNKTKQKNTQTNRKKKVQYQVCCHFHVTGHVFRKQKAVAHGK